MTNPIAIDLRIQVLVGFKNEPTPEKPEPRHDHDHQYMGSVERFCNAWINRNINGIPVCPCQSEDLYALYRMWCRGEGESRPWATNYFFGAIVRLPGWKKRKCRIYRNEGAVSLVQKPLVLPPTKLMEERGTARQAGVPVTRWLTDSVMRFSEALRVAGRAGERLGA